MSGWTTTTTVITTTVIPQALNALHSITETQKVLDEREREVAALKKLIAEKEATHQALGEPGTW